MQLQMVQEDTNKHNEYAVTITKVGCTAGKYNKIAIEIDNMLIFMSIKVNNFNLAPGI